jgi:hypothetical protein
MANATEDPVGRSASHERAVFMATGGHFLLAARGHKLLAIDRSTPAAVRGPNDHDFGASARDRGPGRARGTGNLNAVVKQLDDREVDHLVSLPPGWSEYVMSRSAYGSAGMVLIQNGGFSWLWDLSRHPGRASITVPHRREDTVAGASPETTVSSNADSSSCSRTES